MISPIVMYNNRMKELKLTRGAVAIVDDEDYELLSQYKWHLNGEGYAASGTKNGGVPELMHRIIMSTPKGLYTDHIDENKLNNQKNNLRVCSNRQNLRNRGKQRNNTSGHKGVTYNRANRNWAAQIKVDGKNIYLGSFKSIEDALSCRLSASSQLHGEYAHD